MATYAELKAKAEKIFAEAETQRLKEVAETIDGMKAKIAELGITASDLGFHFTAPATKPAKKATCTAAPGSPMAGIRAKLVSAGHYTNKEYVVAVNVVKRNKWTAA